MSLIDPDNRQPTQEDVRFYCDGCGGEIFVGDEYCQIGSNQLVLCDDCMSGERWRTAV